MSADRIGRECPSCGAFALREYFDIGPRHNADGTWTIIADYSFECRTCLATYSCKFDDIPLIILEHK